MSYEEKYKKALKKAKDMLSYKEVRQEDMEYLFPELKENEDEKIRRFLIDFIKVCGWSEKQFPSREECIAWLEKQGEQKPAWNEEYIANVFEKVGLAKIVREQSNDALTIALQDAMIELSKVTPQQKPTKWSKEDKAIVLQIEQMLLY